MSVDIIEMWHQRARPNPIQADLNTQFGCHLEEIVEMLDVVSIDSMNLAVARNALHILSEHLKSNALSVNIIDRGSFLDAVADQIVTGIGSAYCAHMKPSEAVYRVNRSNWSKYDVDGKPIFDENGKIKKGPNYARPDLTGLY